MVKGDFICNSEIKLHLTTRFLMFNFKIFKNCFFQINIEELLFEGVFPTEWAYRKSGTQDPGPFTLDPSPRTRTRDP